MAPPLSGESYLTTRPLYEFRGVEEGAQDILYMIGLLKNIPEPVHRVVEKYGGKIIFVKTRLTDQPEFQPYRGKTLETRKRIGSDQSVNEMSAIYKNRFIQVETGRKKLTGIVMISVEFDPEYPPDILHEYGHMVDDLLGEEMYDRSISNTNAFIELFKNTQFKSYSYGAFNPQELFAEIFSSFYRSPPSRKDLLRNFPAHYEFMLKFDGVWD